MKKYLTLLLILLLVIPAVSVRFVGHEKRDFFTYDEFCFYAASDAVPIIKELLADFPAIIKKGTLYSGYIAKIADYTVAAGTLFPTYLFLAMISSSMFGIRPEAAFYMNAAFGVLTLPVFFLLCKKLFSTRAALFSTFIMAFSPTHIFYSRSGLACAMALFFLVCAFYFYVKSGEGAANKRNRIATGIFLGLSATSHPVYLFFPIVFFILEVYKLAFEKDKLRWLVLNFYSFMSFFFVIALWEAPHFAAYLDFAIKGKTSFFKNYFLSSVPLNNMNSYLHSFLYGLGAARDIYTRQAKSPLDRYYFFEYLRLAEGIAFIYVMAVSLGFLVYRFIRTRDHKPLLIISWAVLPFLFYSRAHFILQARHYFCLMPALFIAIGYFLDSLLKSGRNKMLALIFITLYLADFAVNSAINTGKIIKRGPRLKPIVDYIQKNGLDDIIANSTALHFDRAKYYTIVNLPGFVTSIKTDAGPGCRSLVAIKSKRYLKKIVMPKVWLNWDNDLRPLYEKGYLRYCITNMNESGLLPSRLFAKAKPLAYVDDPHFVYPPGIYDSRGYAESQMYLKNKARRYIGLYDLRDIYGER